MHHFPSQIAQPCHPLSRLDARVKLLTATALLLMVISCHGLAFPVLISVLCLLLCLGIGIPPRLLALRFSEPLFIAVTILLLKLFTTGSTPLFSLGAAGLQLSAYREGLMEGAGIAARILGGASLLALVGFSTPFTEIVGALSWLKVPQVFIDVSLFAWRYLFMLFEDAHVVYNAQKNRLGYAGYRRGLSSFGTLAGVLVIKAFDNSQSITTAMVQRGYDGRMPLLRHKPLKITEVAVALAVVISLGVIRVL